MVHIIPALLAIDKEDFVRRANLVADIIDLVQIDIMDGTFVPQRSWAHPPTIRELALPVFFEAHLMVDDPEKELASWAEVAERLIFHFESTREPELCIEKIRGYNKKVGLAISPETKIEAISSLLPQVDLVTVMAVNPGKMGQNFIEATKEKISELHARFPQLLIEVDGGLKKEHLIELYDLGVRDFVVGSGIFNATNPAEELQEYLKMLEIHEKRSILK